MASTHLMKSEKIQIIYDAILRVIYHNFSMDVCISFKTTVDIPTGRQQKEVVAEMYMCEENEKSNSNRPIYHDTRHNIYMFISPSLIV